MYGQNKLIATNVLTANKTYTKNGQYRKVTVTNLKKNLPVKTGSQKQLVSGKITEKDLSFVPATKESLTDLDIKTQYQSVSGTDTVFSGDVKVQNDKVVATQEELQAVKISYQSDLFPSDVTNVELALDNLKISGGGGTCPTDQDLYKADDVTFKSLTLTDVTTGMLKTTTGGKIEIATPDIDYATVSTLNTIAIQAQKSANVSDFFAAQAKEYKESASESATNAFTSETDAATSESKANTSATYADTSAKEAATNVKYSIANADSASESANKAAMSQSDASQRANAADDALQQIKTIGLNSLSNNGPVDFSKFKGINVADGKDDTDIATFGQIKNLVQSVTGTDGSIEVTTGTTNPVISLPTFNNIAGDYTAANITVDAFGRVTTASNGSTGSGITEIKGTAPIVATTTTSGTCTIGLSTVTAGNYRAPDITVDAYGRVTAATSTYPIQSVTGTNTQIDAKTTPSGSCTLSLVKTTVTPGNYNPANITVDAYGRVTKASSTTSVQSPYPMTFGGNHTSTADEQLFSAYALPTTDISELTEPKYKTIFAPFDGYISTIYISRTIATDTAAFGIYIDAVLKQNLFLEDSYIVFTPLTPIPVKANQGISISIFSKSLSGNCSIKLSLQST
jgi:hypothetical protein